MTTTAAGRIGPSTHVPGNVVAGRSDTRSAQCVQIRQ